MSQILTSESEKFLNQLPEGPYDEIVEDFMGGKLREKGTIMNGKRNGPFSIYGEDGRLLDKGTYKDGKKHGTVTSYWKDGTLSEITNFVNGDQYGEFRSYYLSGKLRQQGENSHSAASGHWSECYTEDGILLRRFEEGQEVFRHENEKELDPGTPYEI